MIVTRISSLLGKITILFVICCCCLPAQAKYDGGSGSPEYPYLIYTAEQMNAVGANPNYWDKHFKLMANVDLGQFKGEEFNIIGYYGSYPNNKPFTGVFDGNGHTISNFNYSSTDSDEIGIFGYVYGRNAEIKNLVLINPNVDAGTGGHVGSLVGYLRDGTITNCYVDGGRISGEDYVGGLVGYNSHGTVTDCDATSSVSGDRCIGGLVGVNYYGTITNCYSTGSVSGYLYIGGLVGFNSRGTIANSYSSGPISGNAHVGGLAGDNYGTISKCFATGNVSGKYSVGGLVGYQSNGTVKNSYATGSAFGITRVGGLVADNYYGTISNCYSTGYVFGKDYVGGMVGRDSDSIIIASFWDRETSGQWSSDAGEGKTTSEMKDPNTFIGWGSCDDEVVWILDDGNDYPRLAWEGKPGQPLGMQQLSDLLTGNGTEIDPYIIRTGVELQLIGLFPCEWDKNFILDNDVNLAAYTGMQFNIIGNRNNPFNGIFNGRGHRIWNFSRRGLISGDYIGLFARLGSGGTIRNLGMENVSIVTEGRTNYIGGLVGLNEGTVVGCYSTGSISGDWYIGGLVGYNKGTITNCYAIGSTSGHTHIGGLVGMNYEGIISGCYAEGSVSGHVRIGGLAGTNQGAISNSYATCSVYCYGTSGGLVGNNSDGTISRCYATGEITGNEWGSDIGGLVGDYGNSAVTASFWDIETSGQTWSNGGTGKTTAEMQMASTFYAWACVDDFIWTIDEGNDYPRLWWENKPGELITTPSYGGGSGEPNDPYLIYTAEQLNVIGLTPCHHGKYFKLMADIYLSDFTGTSFNIIGYFVDLYSPDNKPFTGVFDGNGHTISNFTYTSTGTNYIGLFGYVSGQIKDLGLINPNVHAGTGNSVGSLVGRVSGGTITNCYVEGGSVDGYSRVGGLVGINYHGMITNCYSTGIVSGYSAVGGLVGYDYYSTIANCYSTGSVSGNKNVGGLVGFNHNGTILNCYSSGSVVGDMNVGGLVGWSCGSVSNCYSTSYVSGIDDVGGLVGYNEAGKVIASFWDIGTSGQSTSAGGTGLLTAEMQTMRTFSDAGWGCEPVWTIDEGIDYPRLVWENKPGELITVPSDLYGGGTGEANDPYLIYTTEQLNKIGLFTCHWDKDFKLMEGIDLGVFTGTSFNIIGYYVSLVNSKPFTGVFDGNGHTISNFTCTSTGTNYIGLFGYVTGEIKNLGVIDPNINAGTGGSVGSLVGINSGRITNCYVKGSSVTGRLFVGGLVGYNYDGIITNCYVEGGSVSGDYYVGGLVGENNGIISHCYSTGSAIGDEEIGGLVGENDYYGTIANCYSTGSVEGDEIVGGLIGYNYRGTIINSYSTSSVTGKYDRVGGLVGENDRGSITGCYATGNVTGHIMVGGLAGENLRGEITDCYAKGETIKGYYAIGGLVGENGYYCTIINCYSTGSVEGVEDVGGLMGKNYGTITNCYSTGSVSGEGAVGGLVGFNYDTITNCYSTASVVGENYVGGLAGENYYPGTITNCYSTGSVSGEQYVGGLVGSGAEWRVADSFWDIQTSGQTTSSGGTGLTTAEMQMMSTFTDASWDFVGETVNGVEDIWWILEGVDYPRLFWEGMKVPMKLTPRTLNCRSEGNWVKAHITLPEGFTVADVDSDRPAVLHSFGYQSGPLYVFVNKDKRVEIEAAFEREAVCSLAGNWPDELTVVGFLSDGNIFLGTSTVRIIHPGMNVIEELAWYWLNADCFQPDFCDGIDMNRDSLVNLPDYALLLKSQVEFVTDE